MPRVLANKSYSSVNGPARRRGTPAAAPSPASEPAPVEVKPSFKKSAATWLRPGHKLSYLALFLFIVVLYSRPSELSNSPIAASIALVVGILTLACFVPTQLGLEGNLTAPLFEVKVIGVFVLIGLIGMPLAMSPGDAWETFSSTFIRCVVMFVVLVNVVRTEARLKGLLLLAMVTAFLLSVGAINEYRLGLATVEGYRVSGRGVGMFGNTNDMALFVVSAIPIAIAFFLISRRKIGKIVYGVLAAVMVASIVLSYSRGAFLGLVAVLIFFAMKLGRRNRLAIITAIVVVSTGFLFLAPGNYGLRLLSIFVPSLDPVQSADARRGELFRSLYTTLRHPLLGIGMGNYIHVSLRGLASHNAYTQVGSEMGIVALACYTMFIVSPLRKLGQIIRNTCDDRSHSRFHYLALGLEASLIAYMVTSFFLSVAYLWYVYLLVGYAVCFRRIYESETGEPVVVQKRKDAGKAPSLNPLKTTAGVTP